MPRSFTITASHMHAFSQQQRQRFEDEMLVYIKKECPADCAKMGEEAARDLIREGIQRAGRYNIILECDVARYIELMLAISPDIDTETLWARQILTQPRLTGQQKLDLIDEHIMFVDAPGEEE